MKNKNMSVMLKPSGYCVCGNRVFFIQRGLNKLVEIDSNLKKIKMVKQLPGEMCGYPDLYNDFCINVNGQIFIVSNCLSDAYSFRVKEQTIEKISLLTEKDDVFVNKAMNIDGNKIVFLPNGSNENIYIDSETMVCTHQGIGKEENIFCEKCYAVDGDSYIFADSGGNSVHFFDRKLQYVSSEQIGREGCRYWGIAVVGSYYILPQMQEDKITIYNKKTKSYVELDYPGDYVSRETYGYSGMYTFGNKVYIFPLFANMILSVDVERMSVQQEFAEVDISVKYDKDGKEIIGETYVDSFVMDETVVVYEDVFGYWHKFDCRNNTVEIVELSEEQEQKDIDELRMMFSSNRLINEGVGLNSLENFLFNLNKE